MNNQLFGYAWYPRKVLLRRENLEGPVGSWSDSAIKYPLFYVGC